MRPKGSLTIGLVGGIGSGKSFVASLFRELGAKVIDADEIVGKLLETATVRKAYVRAWGPGVLGPSGSIDRRAVARIVFGRPGRVRKLNRLIHPKVLREIRKRASAVRRGVVVIDAPLLLESGLGKLCRMIVAVRSARKRRQARVKSRNWSAAEFRRRESAQWPISRKERFADHVIRNDGPPAETRRQVRKLWRGLYAAWTTPGK